MNDNSSEMPELSENEKLRVLYHLEYEARQELEVSLDIFAGTLKAVKDGFRRHHHLAEHNLKEIYERVTRQAQKWHLAKSESDACHDSD